MKRIFTPLVRVIAVFVLLCSATGAWATGGMPQDDQTQAMDSPASGAVIYPPLDSQPEALPADAVPPPQDNQDNQGNQEVQQDVPETPQIPESTPETTPEIQEAAPADGGEAKPLSQ